MRTLAVLPADGRVGGADVQTAIPANLGLHPDGGEAPRSRPPHGIFGRKDPFCLAQPMGSRNVRAPLFESAATMVNDRHHHHDRHRSRVTMVRVVTVLACCFSRSPQRMPRSHAVWFLHPRRDVALPMQHTPDIDVVGVLDVEDQIGIPRQRPGAKFRQVQLVGVSRRSRGRMPADVAVRVLQGVDEAERGGLGAFGQVVRDRVLDVPMGLLARDDGLGLHDRLRVLPVALAAPRTRSRKPSK